MEWENWYYKNMKAQFVIFLVIAVIVILRTFDVGQAISRRQYEILMMIVMIFLTAGIGIMSYRKWFVKQK